MKLIVNRSHQNERSLNNIWKLNKKIKRLRAAKGSHFENKLFKTKYKAQFKIPYSETVGSRTKSIRYTRTKENGHKQNLVLRTAGMPTANELSLFKTIDKKIVFCFTIWLRGNSAAHNIVEQQISKSNTSPYNLASGYCCFNMRSFFFNYNFSSTQKLLYLYIQSPI